MEEDGLKVGRLGLEALVLEEFEEENIAGMISLDVSLFGSLIPFKVLTKEMLNE